MSKIQRRIYLLVLDSLGIGEAVDAKYFNDEGSNTLNSLHRSGKLDIPNLASLGIYNIDNKEAKYPWIKNPVGSYGRMQEKSAGKDSIFGHWEIAGLISNKAMPVFPNGFPESFIKKFEEECGVGTLCNMPYSGTEVIKVYGEEHIQTGKLIVYTSQDSVFQIAAHEDIVNVDLLYHYCKIARELLIDDLAVGRVIARPFAGTLGNFARTANREDFSIKPTSDTLLDILSENNFNVTSIGKIFDIFAGQGINEVIKTKSNLDGIVKTIQHMKEKRFNGLCFVNLVDFDMLYGHRNDVIGYVKALNEFDKYLKNMLDSIENNDVLIITADHGCDPATPSTDHSREDVPVLVYSPGFKKGINLGKRTSFADISATILDLFNIPNRLAGKSFLDQLKN